MSRDQQRMVPSVPVCSNSPRAPELSNDNIITIWPSRGFVDFQTIQTAGAAFQVGSSVVPIVRSPSFIAPLCVSTTTQKLRLLILAPCHIADRVERDLFCLVS